MNKRNKVLAGIGALATIVALYFVYQHIMYVETDDAQIEAHSVMLASKVGGFVVEVKVEEGQRVKKGDLLVRIDDRDYQNVLTQTKGELASALARKDDIETNFKRISSLFHKGAVSHQQYDATQTSLSEARAKFDGISAQVAQAELNLQNTQIKAPSDGFIAKKSVEEGQLASPGVPLIGFVDAGERWVTANFKETQLEGIKIGSHAYVDVDAVSGRNYRGTVTSISSATGSTFALLPPDNATGNFTKVVQRVPVKIRLDNLSDQDVALLRAGLSAVVKIEKH